MFDRPQSGTRAALVHLDFRSGFRPGHASMPAREGLEEFRQLAVAAGADPVVEVRGVRDRPHPGLFVGRGKAGELLELIRRHGVELVLFDHALTPVQERNLERHLGCRVVDRSGLILDIFAQRAQTFEGKLQVELAQLEHLATRLVRGWSHLERQKGGIGLRGPGETQLETDRRLIGRRIRLLNKRLEKVRRQRGLRRQSRRKATVPSVSLVGYTNAGKSTLFNRLTGAAAYAADQLFATLDPTLRRLQLPAVGRVVLADTVGFIRDLPPHLVAAFRATLEETVEADLLLHVIDAHDEAHDGQIAEVNQILQALGAGAIPQIEVYNKIDLRGDVRPRVDRDGNGFPRRVWVSAHSGAGIGELAGAIAEALAGARRDGTAGAADTQRVEGEACAVTPLMPRRLCLSPSAGRLRARLFEWQVVRRESINERGEWVIDVVVAPGMMGYLRRQEGCRIDPDHDAVRDGGPCGEHAGTLQSATL